MIGNQHLWGESWTIYRDKSVWVVGFRGKNGGASSLHYHEYMVNVFYVSCGLLDLGGVHNEILRAGTTRIIRPGDEHRLSFCFDTEGIETYYALPGHEIDENDIVRLSPGRAPEPDAASVQA